VKRFAGEDGTKSYSERSELVTNPSPKRGCFGGFGCFEKPEKQGAKGLRGCPLKMDTFELSSLSLLVPPISFNKVTKLAIDLNKTPIPPI